MQYAQPLVTVAPGCLCPQQPIQYQPSSSKLKPESSSIGTQVSTVKSKSILTRVRPFTEKARRHIKWKSELPEQDIQSVIEASSTEKVETADNSEVQIEERKTPIFNNGKRKSALKKKVDDPFQTVFNRKALSKKLRSQDIRNDNAYDLETMSHYSAGTKRSSSVMPAVEVLIDHVKRVESLKTFIEPKS